MEMEFHLTLNRYQAAFLRNAVGYGVKSFIKALENHQVEGIAGIEEVEKAICLAKEVIEIVRELPQKV